MLVTRKRLLEWQTSSDAARTARTDLAGFYADDVDRAGGRAGERTSPERACSRRNCRFALPLLGLWLAAPWIAWWISQPIEPPAPELTAEQLTFPPPHRAQDLAFL